MVNNNQVYLNTMGIQVWVSRDKAANQQPGQELQINHCVLYSLSTVSDIFIGYLVLDSQQFDGISSAAIENLLKAMMAAIHLQIELLPANNIKQQLLQDKPKFILLMGDHAIQTVLAETRHLSLSDLREKTIFLEGSQIRVFATYHPAHLLRFTQDKRLAWQDLQKLSGFIVKP